MRLLAFTCVMYNVQFHTLNVIICWLRGTCARRTFAKVQR